jgi:ureidoglycolate dehydrogenase (NAD+)
VEGGRINPEPHFQFEQTSAATGVLDADHGFGHAAGMEAMRRAIALARESGAGHVVVRNSSHCGALGYFAEEACRHDMIGTAMTHATARLRSHNGRQAFFGNNPFCWAAPMLGEDPFCYDGAQSGITFNEVKRHQEEGLTLPPGMVADAQGCETTDPTAADQLLPIGDYKGFGLAMMVDVLCALLSGMPAGPDVSKMFDDPMHRRRKLGHYFAALRIDVFQPVERFKAEIARLAARVRAEPALSPDAPVMVPGDPEKTVAADRRKNGLSLSEHDRKSLLLIAERLGVEPPADLLKNRNIS